MKIRQGFVSNSSSASFIVFKHQLTNYQIYQILNWFEEAQRLNFQEKEYLQYCGPNEFNIIDKKEWIIGWTGMDNFGMDEYLEFLGIPDNSYITNDGGYIKPNKNDFYNFKETLKENRKLSKENKIKKILDNE